MSELQQLLDDYWQFTLDENPDVAYDVGDARGRHAFLRQSLVDIERQTACLRGFADRKSKINCAALSARERSNLELLEKSISEALGAYDLDQHLRPMIFPFAPDMFVGYMISSTVLHSVSEVADYLKRLSSIAPLLEGHVERLLAGGERGYSLPNCLLERVASNAESYLRADVDQSVWMQPVLKCTASTEDQKSETRVLISEMIQPAYRFWADTLRGEYAENYCRDSVGLCDEPGGQDYYRFLVKQHTGSDMSPEAIHDIGVLEVERLSAALEQVAVEAGYGGRLNEYRRHLNTSPEHVCADAESLLRDIEVLAKRIDRRIPELFGQLPRMTYGVELIPAERAEQLPAAYAQPSPPSGDTAGIFWLSPLTDRVPRHMHIPLTLHEAWPGHLMHLALVWELDSVPDFVRFNPAGYNAYMEGWALYAERLGYELGFYDAPWKCFGTLEMELFRAIRLVVDTGLHLKGWTREQAVAYITEHQPQSASTIEGEIDRYIGMPAQALSYKMGELKITELRQRAESILGDAFRLSDFHDQVMLAGPCTLLMLDNHIDQWLQQRNVAKHPSTKSVHS